MDDDNNTRGPDGDMGSYVEDARGYDPEESEDSIVDKVKNALGGDTDNPDDVDVEDERLFGGTSAAEDDNYDDNLVGGGDDVAAEDEDLI